MTAIVKPLSARTRTEVMKLLTRLLLALFASQSLAAQTFSQYQGNFTLGDGSVLAIAEWEIDPSAPHVLAFTNLQTERFGVLSPMGPDTFSLNAGLLTGPPVATVAFRRSHGEVVGLQFTPSGAPSRMATRVQSHTQQLVIYTNGPKLGASLLLPSGAGPFPAIVIVPAGPLGRTAAATFPNFFLDQGFAVLLYDRRPAVESDSFETYAADAISAVDALRGRQDIDPSRIGLWGHSQGGWVALIAASKTSSVAFVIDHSGMLLPAWRQELYRVRAEAEADGVPTAEIRAALDFEEMMFRVAKSGAGWDSLAEKMRVSSSAAWMDLVYKPKSFAELRGAWANDFSFDPTPYAARLRQPVLALFGGLDKSTPIESAANLANAMRGSPNLLISFFPTADHAFLDAVTGGNAEIPTLSRFAPGMFTLMSGWLRKR